MKHYFTDFFRNEQPLINQLRNEGKFVYSIIDTGDDTFNIVKNGTVNRFGFLITDTELQLNNGFLTDDEFFKLDSTEDPSLKQTKVFCPC